MKQQFALSIRQPWAWLIIRGLKDVENRSRVSNYRGPLLIHASQTMTVADYEACLLFIAGMERDWVELPRFHDFHLGGIIGRVEMVNCISKDGGCLSPWFTGGFGYVFNNAMPLKFKPCKGQLNFFKVGGVV